LTQDVRQTGERVNILVVEDQAITRELMVCVALAAFPGATVRAAHDLAGALSSARSMEALDMVLLDLGLPDSQGLEGLLRFRADLPQVKAVVVSMQESPEVIADALAAGACGFIPKRLGIPVMIAALKAVAYRGVYLPPGFRKCPGAIATPSRQAV
jgi:DNA-binding NarL/FixJ family response regulator